MSSIEDLGILVGGLQSDLEALATLRARIIELRARQNEVIKAYESQPDYIVATEALDDAQQAAAEIDVKLREGTLAYYRATGEKALLDEALKVRLEREIDYGMKEATEWAKANAPVMLVLDFKAFEKYIGSLKDASLIPPFVTITPKPKATIATDLSKWLPKTGDLDQTLPPMTVKGEGTTGK